VPGVLDKVVIVTGAGGGLGRSYAKFLGANGALVVVNDLVGSRDGSGSGTSMADAVVEEIRGAGGRAVNTLAIEGAKYGITANAVAPMAATRMTADVAPQEVLDKLNPDHVAPAVGYLLSEENQESGSVFVVGGGLVQRVAQFQNDGVTFGEPPNLEEIAKRWPEISDMSSAKLGTNPVA
jgi:NAD(P)-dependent dehydrogenase (short-subunit alcohol dehydrogenase family)